MSLKNQIHNHLYLQYQNNPEVFVNGGELERLGMDLGYKASNASRRCRELEKEGGIEKRENEKGSVEYRYLGPCVKKSKTEVTQEPHARQEEFAGVY